MTEKYQRSKWPYDTEERIRFARGQGDTWDTIADSFGVSTPTIYIKGKKLGLIIPKNIRRFTPEEDAIIRADYIANVTVQMIAAKLGRSYGVISQRIYHNMKDLVGTRTARGTKVLNRYGVELLQAGSTLEEAYDAMKERLIKAKATARVAALDAQTKARQEKIELMFNRIAKGEDRNTVIFETRAMGMPLAHISQALGITRERVRQICDATALKIALRTFTT